MSLFALRACALAIPFLMSLPVAGCAAHSGAALYDVGPSAGAELQRLARRAQDGDKYAQFELGTVFEEGRDLPRDEQRAAVLYRLAARGRGGRLWVYSPPIRKGSSGRLIPIDTGTVKRGLPEAARRLNLLKLRSGRAPADSQ